MGQCTLGKLLSKACNVAGIQGKKTNHSLRKTCVKALSKAGVQDTAIMKITGHKSMSSLMSYNQDLEMEDHRELSNILCTTTNQKKKKSTSTTTTTLIARSQTTSTTCPAAAHTSVTPAIDATATSTATTQTPPNTCRTTTCGTSTTVTAENQTFGSHDNPLSGSFVFSGTFNNCTFYFK